MFIFQEIQDKNSYKHSRLVFVYLYINQLMRNICVKLCIQSIMDYVSKVLRYAFSLLRHLQTDERRT